MGLRVESTDRSSLGMLDANAADVGFRAYLAPCRSFRHGVPNYAERPKARTPGKPARPAPRPDRPNSFRIIARSAYWALQRA